MLRVSSVLQTYTNSLYQPSDQGWENECLSALISLQGSEILLHLICFWLVHLNDFSWCDTLLNDLNLIIPEVYESDQMAPEEVQQAKKPKQETTTHLYNVWNICDCRDALLKDVDVSYLDRGTKEYKKYNIRFKSMFKRKRECYGDKRGNDRISHGLSELRTLTWS